MSGIKFRMLPPLPLCQVSSLLLITTSRLFSHFLSVNQSIYLINSLNLTILAKKMQLYILLSSHSFPPGKLTKYSLTVDNKSLAVYR